MYSLLIFAYFCMQKLQQLPPGKFKIVQNLSLRNAGFNMILNLKIS
jgi:hypothetical protein